MLSKAIGKPFSIQAHHIFPKAKLYENKYDSTNGEHIQLVNEIANFVFITANANMNFFTDLPEKYLPLVKELQPGELEKQLIPLNANMLKIENY